METTISKRILNLMSNPRKARMLLDYIRNPKNRNKYDITVSENNVDIAFKDEQIEAEFRALEQNEKFPKQAQVMQHA